MSHEKPNDMHSIPEFLRGEPGVIYVRQSNIKWKEKRAHPFEIQTEQFLEHLRNTGRARNITVLSDDVSGVGSRHVRPGITEMLEMVETHQIRWIASVAVNRLTRDPWLILPGILMKICCEYDIWVTTLTCCFNFTDPYNRHIFMREAEKES